MREKIIKKDFYEVLPLEEIRHFLRISGSYEDILLKNITESIICFAEDFLDMEIQKKEILLTGKYLGKILLNRPLIEIIFVKSEGKPINFTLHEFLYIDTAFQKNVEVLYVCGFEEDEIPADLKMTMLLHAVYLYDSKGDRGPLPRHIRESYSKYKKINF